MFCKACKQNHPLKNGDKWCDRSEIEIIRDDLVDKFEMAVRLENMARDKEIEELKAQNARYREALEFIVLASDGFVWKIADKALKGE